MSTEKMLLYTKVAAPKVPKRRSRSGCNFCKDKKKKCDEVRPSCARCQQYGRDCQYGPVQPRQRRKIGQVKYHHSTSYGAHEILDSYLEMSPSYADDSMKRPGPTPSKLDMVGPCVEWGTPESSSTNADDGCYPGDVSANEAIDTVRVLSIVTDDVPELYTDPSRPLFCPAGNSSPMLELCWPSFVEFTQDFHERFLLDYFCNTLSRLIVLREDQGNPFQKLVLPLAHKSQAVKGAIYALASAHLVGKAGNRLENHERSIQFHNEAVRNLANLIEKGGGVNQNELLATIMLIIYYEVLVQRQRSNLVESHLKGAMVIIMSNRSNRKDRTSIFLEEAFRFYDVIGALSSGTAPLSSDFTNRNVDNSSMRCPEQQVSIGDGVDALLGLATSLWPVIHKLSGLLALRNELEALTACGDVSKISVMQARFDVDCAVVESSLSEWQPAIPPEYAIYGDLKTISPSARGKARELQSILNNALAYRHSALVYLYRIIYDFPRRHSVVQHHASVSLVHCKATVLHQGPMGALLWPLFVASCEAVDATDRHSALDTFQRITHRQGMANIDRAWEVVQEVWNRADEAEASGAQLSSDGMGLGRNHLWRRVSEDMGVSIVFG